MGLFVGVPGTAQAQAGDLGDADPLFSGIATLLIAAIALIVIAWQRRQARRESLRADHFAARSSLLEAALDSVPWPYCGWTAGGSPLVDPAFATMLGRAEIESEDDLLAILTKDDAATLKAALRRLRADGAPFEVDLRRADGVPVRLIGRRGHGIHAGSNKSTELLDLIWLADPAATPVRRSGAS